MQITADFATAVVELSVHGRWSQRLGMDVSAAIRNCLAEPPSAIIADLHDLGDPDGTSMPTWLAARRAAVVQQPPVQLALCLPTTAGLDRRLRRAGAHQHLPLFATMLEARAVVTARLPVAEQMQTRLPAQMRSARTARDLVTRACGRWHLPRLLLRARLVMSELVANAVEHAGTDIWISVSQRGTGLHLAVGDGVADLPRLRHPAPGTAQTRLPERGWGLRLVHLGAAAWGAMPVPGGKVVWATVRPRHDDVAQTVL
ncbi:ATP-binding protein [Actinoplanes sp. NPDC051346]|uniref:ATP-binding protein n=1 Tax=Actinoplanes sp. NPDC051346 TaxID=3155048 RepID=UPI00342CE2F2